MGEVGSIAHVRLEPWLQAHSCVEALPLLCDEPDLNPVTPFRAVYLLAALLLNASTLVRPGGQRAPVQIAWPEERFRVDPAQPRLLVAKPAPAYWPELSGAPA